VCDGTRRLVRCQRVRRKGEALGVFVEGAAAVLGLVVEELLPEADLDEAVSHLLEEEVAPRAGGGGEELEAGARLLVWRQDWDVVGWSRFGLAALPPGFVEGVTRGIGLSRLGHSVICSYALSNVGYGFRAGRG
jgi:hypothetical protein